MRGLRIISSESDVNANLWLRHNLASPIANDHSELIKVKDEWKMYLFLLKPFLKECLSYESLAVLMTNCTSYSKK